VESSVFSSDNFLSLLFVFHHNLATDPNFEFDVMPGLAIQFILNPKQRWLQDGNSLS
jgi:hypothetical protein